MSWCQCWLGFPRQIRTCWFSHCSGARGSCVEAPFVRTNEYLKLCSQSRTKIWRVLLLPLVDFGVSDGFWSQLKWSEMTIRFLVLFQLKIRNPVFKSFEVHYRPIIGFAFLTWYVFFLRPMALLLQHGMSNGAESVLFLKYGMELLGVKSWLISSRTKLWVLGSSSRKPLINQSTYQIQNSLEVPIVPGLLFWNKYRAVNQTSSLLRKASLF